MPPQLMPPLKCAHGNLPNCRQCWAIAWIRDFERDLWERHGIPPYRSRNIVESDTHA